MRTTSVRGEKVDFARYISENGDMPAIGNAKLNARGDRIDQYGNVVQTRADMAADYHRSSAKSVKQVSIKNLESEVFQTPAMAVKDIGDRFLAAEQAKIAAAEEKFGTKTRKLSDRP